MGRFNVEDFKAVVDQHRGFAKQNRFFVSFVMPQAVTGASQFRNAIEYYCESTSIPGGQLETYDHKRFTYGPTEKRPFAPKHNSCQLTIMADGNGLLWKVFSNWINFIMPQTLKGGIASDVDEDVAGLFPASPYELEYKKHYVTDMAIYHLPEEFDDGDVFGNYISRTILRDAFPSQISDMHLAWADNNRIAWFTVQMEYTDWHNVENLG